VIALNKTNIERLEEALYGDEGFLIKLRMMNGFDENKFEEVCSILKDCEIEWKNIDSIPKRAVNLIVEICPAIMTYLDNSLYCKKDEKWNEKMWDAYLKIYDLILNCCG